MFVQVIYLVVVVCEQVTWLRQQVAKKRVKRSEQRLFNDPKWPRMWYLVGMVVVYYSVGIVSQRHERKSQPLDCWWVNLHVGLMKCLRLDCGRFAPQDHAYTLYNVVLVHGNCR
jgi:hypothetical protein